MQKAFAEKTAGLSEGYAIWGCEFCGAFSVLTIDREEVPKIGDGALDYILEPPEASEDHAGSDVKMEMDKNEPSRRVIFCIDVSGSMIVSQQAPGNFKVKGRDGQEDPFSFLSEDDPE